MDGYTSIGISIKTKHLLDKLKIIENETYDHLLNRLIDNMESKNG